MRRPLFLILFALSNTILSFSQSVKIGKKIWTTQNLNINHFRNGDLIPEAKTDEEWEKADKNKQPAWCYYNNDAANGARYGKLYNWYAVNDPRGLAPAGWHVPSADEWNSPKFSLGDDIGNQMKSKEGWNKATIECPNCKKWSNEYRSKISCDQCNDTRSISTAGNGTNSSGFSGLPGGARYFAGFKSLGENGYWWTSDKSGNDYAWDYFLSYNNYFLFNEGRYRGFGFSVRCIKD